MAEVLSEFDDFGNGRRGSSHYDRYLDGQIWKLMAEDIGGAQLRGVQVTLTQRAKKLGLKARTRIVGDAVVVQATKADGSPLPAVPIRQVV